MDPTTEVGPLIEKVYFDKVYSYFGVSRSEGAEPAAEGSWFAGAVSAEQALKVQPIIAP